MAVRKNNFPTLTNQLFANLYHTLSKLFRLMYNKLSSLLLFCILGFAVLSCGKKDEPAPAQACQTNNTFTVRIANNTSYNFRLTFNGSEITNISSRSEFDETLTAGRNTIRAVQTSGIVTGIRPVDTTFSITGAQCSTVNLSLPAPGCEIDNTLLLEIRNLSTNDYRVTYNGDKTVNIGPNGTASIQATAGFRSVRALQTSGLITGLNAADVTLAYNGSACGSASVSIPQECESQNFGTIRIVNNSSNPYRVDINGNFFVNLQGGTSINAIVGVGAQTIKATQLSGYVFTPTVRETTQNVARCANNIFQFP